MAMSEENILKLMGEAIEGKLVVPNFQRRFIWKRQQVEELLESVLSGYFIGTLLFYDVSDGDTPFAPMLFDGVEDITNGVAIKPSRIVLDGQQRLTSVFYALYAPQKSLANTNYPYKFYLELNEESLNGDFGGSIFSTRWDYYDDINVQYEESVIPITELKDINSWFDWLAGYKKYHEENGDYDANRFEMIQDLLNNFNKYTVTIVTLSSELDDYDVVEIFERVNSTGTPLSVFELLTARFYNNFNLRKMWEEVFEKFELINEFAEDERDEQYPRAILQTIALLRGRECKKRILFDLSPEGFINDWESAAESIEKALERLKNTSEGGYGVINKSWIPYRTMIPPLATLINSIESEKVDMQKKFTKLHNWYWASIFTNRYQRATDTAAYEDIEAMKKWFSDDESIIEQVNKCANFNGNELRSEDSKRSAVYQGIVGLIVLKGALDFFSGDTIELHELDDHHIFPKNFLESISVKGREANNILNRTLITATTNRKIQSESPSGYLVKMEKELGSKEELKKVLDSHFINSDAHEAMKKDDYDAFIDARKKEVEKEIRRRTSQ